MAADARLIAKDLARRSEGLVLHPYLCPARVWSIGYGATFYLDGRRVQPTDPPISLETAERLLDATLARTYMPAAQRLCPKAAGGALAALTDFCLNLGPTRLAGTTLRRKYNAGDIAGAKRELKKWVRGGGRVLPGLVLRRAAEAALL